MRVLHGKNEEPTVGIIDAHSVKNTLVSSGNAGRYTIIVTYLAGRPIQSQVLNLANAAQTTTINFARMQAKGSYMINVVDQNKRVAFTGKMVVE